MKTRKQWSMREVVAMTGIPEHRIAYQHRIGCIPEPSHVAGKRIYTRVDVARICRHWGIQLKEAK